MSIGQGYMLSTPLQVLMIYQAIGNDGIMLKPSFVEYFVDKNNNKKSIKKPEIARKLDIKPSTIKEIQTALKLATKYGTARKLSTCNRSFCKNWNSSK